MGLVKPSFNSFLSYLVIGNLSSHFYYIVIVMQFYLLMPLWRRIVKSVPWYIALPISIMVSFLMLNISSVFRLADVEFKYGDRVFLTYLFFWICGLYAGKNYEFIHDNLLRGKRAVFLSGIAVILFVTLTYAQYAKNVYIYDTSYLKTFSDILSIFILLCICITLKNSACGRLRYALNLIYEASYSVYLSHCLFLTVGTLLLQRMGVTKIASLLILRALICYTLPFALYFGYSKVKKH